MAAELATQAITFGFAAIDCAVSLVSRFTDTGVDLVSPDVKRDADGEVDVVVTVGNGAEDVAVITDDGVAQSKLKVRILLQTGNRFFCAIASNLGGQSLQRWIALLGTRHEYF